MFLGSRTQLQTKPRCCIFFFNANNIVKTFGLKRFRLGKIWGCNESRGFGIQESKISKWIHLKPSLYPFLWPVSQVAKIQVATSVARARPEPPVIPKSKSWETNCPSEDFGNTRSPERVQTIRRVLFLWNQLVHRSSRSILGSKICLFEGFPRPFSKKAGWYSNSNTSEHWGYSKMEKVRNKREKVRTYFCPDGFEDNPCWKRLWSYHKRYPGTRNMGMECLDDFIRQYSKNRMETSWHNLTEIDTTTAMGANKSEGRFTMLLPQNARTEPNSQSCHSGTSGLVAPVGSSLAIAVFKSSTLVPWKESSQVWLRISLREAENSPRRETCQ